MDGEACQRTGFRAAWRLRVGALALVGFAARPLSLGAAEVHQSVGWRPTAIPLVNFSSDDGTGYGLRANLYRYDGTSVPYRRQCGAQVFFTTRGKWVHRLLVDTPNLRPGRRLEVELVYEKEEYANYYGGLSDQALRGYTRDQKTFRRAVPSLRAMWIRDLRGPWRARAGTRLSHQTIDPNAATGSVLAALDPLGAGGGTLLQVDAALRWDTLDNYNDPAGGLLEELLVQYGVGGGSDFNGLRLGYEHRHFRRLAGGLVLALRLAADLVAGDWPFYEELDLGGSSTVRGQAAARDRGEGRFLLNGELRWRGLRLSERQHIRLGAVAFLDLGQIYRRADGPSLDDWRRGAGAGLRFHWASTIVRADYGRSAGRTGIYITFGQVY